MKRLPTLFLTLFLALFVIIPDASGQTGTITGTVVSAETGDPLIGANVTVQGTALGAAVNSEGRYTIDGVPAGGHVVRVAYIGYAEQSATVTVGAGETVTVDFELREATLLGNEVVVTGTKRPEKLLESPVTIARISAAELNRTGGGSFLSALKNVKGIDFVSAGINAQGISARGFSSHFNTRMLMMVNGRLATLPGTGLPQGNFLPTAPLDVKAIEVVIGPASALYGPNAHTGVVNIITKSPWDQSGIAVALRGGGHNLIDGTFRAAGTVSGNFGWKLTGQYLSANDFEPVRANGPSSTMRDSTHYYGTPLWEGQITGGYDIMSAKLEGSLYYRFGGGWMLKGTYGWSENDNYGLTNLGRNHIRNWQVSYQNLQLSSEHWYVQATHTRNDAGKTYQINAVAGLVAAQMAQGKSFEEVDIEALREAVTFVDKGQLYDAEVQYRNAIGGVQFVTGVQARRYLPESEGTFLADFKGIDATEVGGYLQLDQRFLEDRLRLNVAARVDHHSTYGTQFSPKAALVATVAPGHNLRVTYNRAFKAPTILESHLYIGQIALGNSSGYIIKDADGNTVAEIDPLAPEEVNSVELGYKGIWAEKLFVEVVAYNSWYNNFISPLTQVAFPYGPFLPNPRPATYAYYPDGTIVAEGVTNAKGLPLDGFLLTYRNFGVATVRGLDAGFNLYASDHVNFGASLSLIDLAEFTAEEGFQPLLLNVPSTKLKSSVTVTDIGLDGSFVNVSGRWQSAYTFRSGYWDSEVFYAENGGEIPARFVMDITAGFDVPSTRLSLKASVTNVFNNETPPVLGAPVRGRFFWVMATYRFDGLRF